MKRYFLILLICSLLFSFSATALKVGVTAGPHADIVNKINDLAKKKGLQIDVIEFSNFTLPNEALNAGDLDLNSFQHEQYLNEQKENRGYKLKAIAKTVVMPLGVYSTKIKSLDGLPKEAKVIIPNDPTNGGRALKLLAKNSIIDVKDVANPSILDITSNPKNLSFVEIEAALVPRSLPDVDAAITNTDWILQSGRDPKSALVQEDKDSPYVNVIVVRAGDETKADILKFVKLYHSQEIRDFIDSTYKGAVIPAW